MKTYLALMALAGWFALIAQFYINITGGFTTAAEVIVRYFSYFTITTNLLVAITCTTLLINPVLDSSYFFSRQGVLAAVTVYILIVGIIYNVILRSLWNPQGLQWVVDELLHSAIPLLFFGFWIIFAPKDELLWKDIWSWLIYPFVYLLFILIRGNISNFYPYPFINVRVLGLNKFLANSMGITLAFILVSLFMVTLGKFLSQRKTLV
ncbi:MAG TPA: Pr6Pr family membrane protein [Puia sp.]|jgi:hypothetical protein